LFMDEFNFNEERKLSDVKLAEINGMVKHLFEMRATIEEMEEKVSEKKAELETLKQTIMLVLEAQNMTKLPTEHGLVYTTTKFQVSMPKDPARAAQLRAYFAKRGMEDMLTVNHMTLNSVFNSIVEEKETLGEKIDMKDIIPGVDEPTARQTLAMKKGK
jgi:hypothetical protein